MKKLLLAMPVALCFGLVSCGDKAGDAKAVGGMSDAAKKNLDAMHAIQKMFETKDFSKVGDYMADSAVDHSGMGGDVKGLPAIKSQLAQMSAMTEGDQTTIIKELADDDYVMSWGRYTGTMKTAAMGMKAGDKMNDETVEITRFNKDGKAVEHWTMMPPPPMPATTMDQPKLDSVKMETPKK